MADIVKHPFKALAIELRGPRTEGPMAPEIPLDKQRPAEYNYSKHVDEALERIGASKLEQAEAEAAAE